MPETTFYFDIAAVVVMLVTTGWVLLRRVSSRPISYAYLLLVIVITLTSVASMCSQIFDNVANSMEVMDAPQSVVVRNILRTTYFALRSLNILAYLVFIAAASDTLHRLQRNLPVRLAFWVPITLVLVIVLTNPLHGGIYYYSDVQMQRGPLMWTMYLTATFYSLWGVEHLLRWRCVLGDYKFSSLMALYPLNLIAVLLQTYIPQMRVEMFFTAVAVLLVSVLVIRPEDEIDTFTETLSIKAFDEMCRRAFIIQKPLCLVFIDIANKDRLRELAGENMFRNIVRAVSAQVGTYLRRGDALYYLRNGLFCISAANVDASDSLAIAMRSSKEGQEAAKSLPEQSMVVQLRTCIVRVPQDVQDNETLQTFKRRIGRIIPQPCVTTYEELSKHKDFLLQMNLANVVSRGIVQKTFEVYYQPIWSVENKCFGSAEALVRLNDPEFGFVSPALFIPEAEQSGAIIDIGAIILQRICEFLGRVDFDATRLEYVEVNLSVDQCMQPNLVPQIMGLLEQHHIGSHRINLEITETSASYSQSAIDANMRALASQGITLSLDDYGTGYSSLTRMLGLPFDIVKIDKSFVWSMDEPAARTVLADTIAMLKKIGKKVLVEGVETRQQEQQLMRMGVDYIQGYLYAQPMPEQDFVAFLLEHNTAEK